jgi:adenylate cyclase, class 2
LNRAFAIVVFSIYWTKQRRLLMIGIIFMRNIEIKARLSDIAESKKVAERLAGARLYTQLRQVDTYFKAANGRLKLREEEGGNAKNVLIYYRRPDQSGPKRSDYELIATDSPAELKRALSNAIGVRVVVKKQRTVFLCENVRIHLDEVDGLGAFLEFEAVMPDGTPDSAGEAQLRELMQAFSINKEDLIEDSYSDLLERKSNELPESEGKA